MDGVPDVQPTPKIEPGSYFDYRFRIVNPPGTHIYHTHHNSAKQQMMGLTGGFIILDSKEEYNKKISRDYFILLQEFKIPDLPMKVVKQGVYDIDPHSHEFNFSTMNGRRFPFVTPLNVRCGERMLIILVFGLSTVIYLTTCLITELNLLEVCLQQSFIINLKSK